MSSDNEPPEVCGYCADVIENDDEGVVCSDCGDLFCDEHGDPDAHRCPGDV